MNEVSHSFKHPADGHLVTYFWHPKVAQQMRLMYEAKGFQYIPPDAVEEAKAEDAEAQAVAAAEYVPPPKRGRKPNGFGL